MSELKFGTEGLREKARDNFIGKVVKSEYPVTSDAYPDTEQWHVEYEPLTVYEKNQHEWMSPSKTLQSKWGAMQKRLEYLKIVPKKVADFVGKILELESVTIEVGFDKKQVEVWLPVRVVDEAEAKELEEKKGTSSGPIV